MPNITIPELDALFQVQRKAFAAEVYPSLETRLDRLRRLETAMVTNRVAIQESVAADFGNHHPIVTDMFETGGVLGRNRYIQANLADWLKDSERPLLEAVHGASKARVIRQPKGVMGNIAPWNFPVECALVMVSDMLAAGNRVIVKASEFAPATGELLAKIVSDAFAPEELALVNGGLAVSKHFAGLPWDHLTYTGGGAAAKSIMAAAAANLTPLTLELGGKNPTLFLDDGMTPDLIERFLYFRIFKGGQVCTSPDYVLVPEARVEEWMKIAKERWSAMYPTYVGHPDATGAINRRHYDRILAYLHEASTSGADVVSLNGERPDANRLQIPMFAVIDPPESISVAQDEVFGPVTVVKPYKSLDEAISYINARPRPLAAYVVGRDADKLERFARQVVAGGVGINVFGFQGAEPSLPFGGVGPSGMGYHSGFEGFLNYTHLKAVFDCSDDNLLMQSLKAPYGAFAQQVADSIFAAA